MLGDAGDLLFLDGKRVGKGIAILGGMAAGVPHEVRAVSAGDPAVEVLRRVTVAAKDTRWVDLRRAPVAGAVVATPAVPAPASPAVPSAVAAARVAKSPKPVRVVSADAAKGLIALGDGAGAGAPLEAGGVAKLQWAGGPAALPEIRCVRVFGGVSVCTVSGRLPASLPGSVELVR